MTLTGVAEEFVNQNWPTASYEKIRPTNSKNGTLFQFFCSRDRYKVNFNLPPDWCQADNQWDRWYSGDWLNPFLLQIISYLESDVYLITFENKTDFINYVNDYQYDDNFIGIDAQGDRLKQRFQEMGLGDRLHREYNEDIESFVFFFDTSSGHPQGVG